MVLSPSAEVYFLDTSGKILAFHSPKNEIKLWAVPLLPLKKFIERGGKVFIKGSDPKEPGNTKIFSASIVTRDDKKLGLYLYCFRKQKV
jgi:hypothetical protein